MEVNGTSFYQADTDHFCQSIPHEIPQLSKQPTSFDVVPTVSVQTDTIVSKMSAFQENTKSYFHWNGSQWNQSFYQADTDHFCRFICAIGQFSHNVKSSSWLNDAQMSKNGNAWFPLDSDDMLMFVLQVTRSRQGQTRAGHAVAGLLLFSVLVSCWGGSSSQSSCSLTTVQSPPTWQAVHWSAAHQH